MERDTQGIPVYTSEEWDKVTGLVTHRELSSMYITPDLDTGDE